MNIHTAQSNSAPEKSPVSGSSQSHVVFSHPPKHGNCPATFQISQGLRGRGWVDESTFIPPHDFNNFYSRFPRFVRDFVRRRMMNQRYEDQQDRESELLHFLMCLPERSKFRVPGTNGHQNGCHDRIMTFNPGRCGGGTPGQFLAYVNRILLNRFITLQRKHKADPACRSDTLRLSADWEEYGGSAQSKMPSMDRLPFEPQMNGLTEDRLVWSHVVVQRFVTFIEDYNPELLSVLTELSMCRKLSDAQSRTGLDAKAFCRARSRLRTLYRSFQSGSRPPKQRRPYRDRQRSIVLPSPALCSRGLVSICVDLFDTHVYSARADLVPDENAQEEHVASEHHDPELHIAIT